jgi:hypothetical protein
MMDAGDPDKGRIYGGFPWNRALPSPSPAANLAGIWKDKKQC